MDAQIRNDIADRLESLANEPMWSPDLCQQCLDAVRLRPQQSAELLEVVLRKCSLRENVELDRRLHQ
jgi:hypothetical protein